MIVTPTTGHKPANATAPRHASCFSVTHETSHSSGDAGHNGLQCKGVPLHEDDYGYHRDAGPCQRHNGRQGESRRKRRHREEDAPQESPMTNPALRIKATQRPIVAGLSTQLDDHSVAWAKSQRARGIIDALVSATIEGAARLFVRHS